MKSLSELYKQSQETKAQFRLALIWIVVMILFFLIGPFALAQELDIKQIAKEEATAQGLDPELVLAVIEVESKFNPYAVGQSHGEIGLMQLHPRYFPQASFDIRRNIHLGVQELVRIKRKKLMYAGCAWFVYYNTGVNRQVPSPSEHPYYKKVTAVYPEYCERLTVAGVN